MGGRKKKWKKQSDGNLAQPQRESTILFLDETLFNCQPVHAALESLGVEYIKHGAVFTPGTPDTEWLPVVGENKWVVLTSDKRIRFNELERELVISNEVRQFVFTSGNLSGAMMGEILKIAMPRMQKILSDQIGPFIACISQAGTVIVRYDRFGPISKRKKKESSTTESS
jgi:hypothetical protein